MVVLSFVGDMSRRSVLDPLKFRKHIVVDTIKNSVSIVHTRCNQSVLHALSVKYGLIRPMVRIWAKHDLTRALTCLSMFNALSKCTPRF
jgi:hypothetical protein